MGGANHGAEPVDECRDSRQLAGEQLLELLVDRHGCWHGDSEARGTDSSGSGTWNASRAAEQLRGATAGRSGGRPGRPPPAA
ncbi:hypothetical protein GCM10010464_73320 [Pseudonocardia yunnanensis]